MTTTPALPFGVEYGTATPEGGDYEIEQCASHEAALERLAEYAADGYVTGDAALTCAPGCRYALAVYLDASGCPTGEIPEVPSAPARVAFHLTVYERSADGRRSLVSDGDARYWIDSSALDEDVPDDLGSDEALADAYARWCRGDNTSEA